MDYSKIYNSIIDNAKAQNRQKYKGEYFESHHIIPRCMGGNNEKENLVLLTAREHFLCHRLLCEMYTVRGLKFAFWGMCNQTFGDVKREYRISSRTYEHAKKLAAIEFSKIDRKGEKNSFFGKNHSEETRKNWSHKRKGKFTGAENSFYGKTHSEKTINQIKESRRKYLETESAHRQLSMSNQHRKIVKCIHDNPVLNIEFESIKAAAIFFEIKYSSMKYIIKKYGKYKEYRFETSLANC